TSFFAFTGNKFEFRAVGSSASCAWPMTVLNAIVAESLHLLIDKIEKETEKLMSVDEKWEKAAPVLQEIFQAAQPILFSGNGYSSEWREDAKKRGLPLSLHSHDAYQALLANNTFKVFEGILTDKELHSRYDIFVEQYAKTVLIEAKIMIELFRTQILPACLTAQEKWARSIYALFELKIEVSPRLKDGLETLSSLITEAVAAIDEVYRVVGQAEELGWDAKAKVLAELVIPKMGQARSVIDQLEGLVEDVLWPLPKYRELLFIR
ncbi:MAG: hypothetical protein K2X08_08460, partial [Chlamydiales bacterium]|nr:hypothetical protein [Chlamydiales bacterium]